MIVLKRLREREMEEAREYEEKEENVKGFLKLNSVVFVS